MKKILILILIIIKYIKNLVNNAKKKLSKQISISILDVPGVLKFHCNKKKYKKFDGFVALGCVIKGQTPHFDLICHSTFNAILNLSLILINLLVME